jgi:hypothetical protein
MLTLGKFSIGVGDRFAHQARAQLRACQLAAEKGVEVIPVWNKSNREHTIIGSEPGSVRASADAAVRELKWAKPYHVDADHIRLDTVERFLPACDFYTIDVADSIGQPATANAVKIFTTRHPELLGTLSLPGVSEPFTTTAADIERIIGKYLKAVKDAGAIYNKITWSKGADNFITEVSMDETDEPQTPQELLLILAALADEGVPVQTIAPKFTGRFNKGRPRSDCIRGQEVPPASEPQAQRSLRQRQVFALRTHPSRATRHRGRRAPEDRGHDLARRGHRPSGSRGRRVTVG